MKMEQEIGHTCVVCAAVQDERQKSKDEDEEADRSPAVSASSSSSSATNEMPIEKLLEAEMAMDTGVVAYSASQVKPYSRVT